MPNQKLDRRGTNTQQNSAAARHNLRAATSLALFILLPLAFSGQDRFQGIMLDGASAGRTFDGIGALSAGASSRLLIDYPEPQRSQVLDYLFKPGYGAALQHLKVEIGADVNSTDGAEPSHMRSPTDHNTTRGYEWWLMAQARKRNPKIILDALPWGAPGWVGTNTLYTPKMAGYVVDFLEAAKKEHRLDIAYTGVWNEKPYDAAYVKELHDQLLLHAPEVKLVCCDEYAEGKVQWSVADAMMSDTVLAHSVDVLSVHYPQEHGQLTTTAAARASGKPLWSSEDQPNPGSGPIVARDWEHGGRQLAMLYNRNYLEGALTKTEIWSPVTAYYDILAAPNSGLMYANTPWSGHYEVQSTIWVTAHTTQFAQPGWQYLDRSCGHLQGGGSFVTLRAPDGGNWSTVIETVQAQAAQRVDFTLAGGLAQSTVHVWKTDARINFLHVAELKPVLGHFAYTLDPDAIYTLTTTTGQGRGIAEPSPAKPFPMPWREDFETTANNLSPRFLADQDGAFEVHPCTGRAGRCLEQVITIKPVPWGPLPDPFTLAGDSAWQNYRVSADFRAAKLGEVTLMGRIDSADVFRDGKARWPSGYILSFGAQGTWQLCSTSYGRATALLAHDRIAPISGAWHHATLDFRGPHIEVVLDGKLLASVVDDGHKAGMIAVGSDWSRAQIDNVQVTTL